MCRPSTQKDQIYLLRKVPALKAHVLFFFWKKMLQDKSIFIYLKFIFLKQILSK